MKGSPFLSNQKPSSLVKPPKQKERSRLTTRLRALWLVGLRCLEANKLAKDSIKNLGTLVRVRSNNLYRFYLWSYSEVIQYILAVLDSANGNDVKVGRKKIAKLFYYAHSYWLEACSGDSRESSACFNRWFRIVPHKTVW